MNIAAVDGSTLVGAATLVSAFCAGVVSIINAIVGARSRGKIRDDLAVVNGKADVAAAAGVAAAAAASTLSTRVDEVHAAASEAAINTNGALSRLQAENDLLKQTNEALRSTIEKTVVRSARTTDPVPVPGHIQGGG